MDQSVALRVLSRRVLILALLVSVVVHSIFPLLSARHVVRAALPAFPRPLMRSPAFPTLCDALYFLFQLNAALGHSLGLGITPQRVTIKPHPVL